MKGRIFITKGTLTYNKQGLHKHLIVRSSYFSSNETFDCPLLGKEEMLREQLKGGICRSLDGNISKCGVPPNWYCSLPIGHKEYTGPLHHAHGDEKCLCTWID